MRLDSLPVFSHTRTLTVTIRDDDRQALCLSASRFPDGWTLPLDCFTVSWVSSSYIAPLRLVLFPILNPARAVFRRRQVDSVWTGLPGSVSLDRWTDLEVIEFEGSIFVAHDSIHRNRIGGLPRPTLDRRRVVRLHVGSLCSPANVPLSLFLKHAVLHHAFSLGLDGMQEGSIELVVGGEEEKAAAEVAVSVSDTVPEKYRSLFTVVVDG